MSATAPGGPVSRGRKGPQPQFSPAEVVTAAMRIVEAHGAEQLTMRRLASELGISAMGLYRYVASKDELLVLLLNESVRSVRVPPVNDNPRTEVLGIYIAMHDALAEQRWALDVLVGGRLFAPAALQLLDRVYGALMLSGLNAERAVAVNRVLWNLMIGDLIAGRAVGHREAQVDAPTPVKSVEMPHLAATEAARDRSHGADSFAGDLRTVLEALLP